MMMLLMLLLRLFVREVGEVMGAILLIRRRVSCKVQLSIMAGYLYRTTICFLSLSVVISMLCRGLTRLRRERAIGMTAAAG